MWESQSQVVPDRKNIEIFLLKKSDSSSTNEASRAPIFLNLFG